MMQLTDLTVMGADGAPISLDAYRGQVMLIVNTASQCGFTPQYEGLEALYRRYRARRFAVLAFPCNQFGAQEPGDAAAIASFCSLTYDVTFPVFAKVAVNGPETAPLFGRLKAAAPGLLGSTAVKWNFTKFLVDRAGRTVRRYAPTTKPAALAADIEEWLAADQPGRAKASAPLR